MIATPLLRKLIERIAQRDDAVAYKELFLLYHRRLLSFSMTITRSKESAEEVVSDVFFKLWLHRATLTTIENFNLYIYIVTKNLSINRLLKERRDQYFSLDETVINLSSIQPNPEQLMITSEMQKRILSAIEDLPPKCLLIFKLVREDGLKYKEVAELLCLSPKTIENQMTIALKKIGESIRFDLTRTTN
ncbi:MAG: RNA polymerase sigma-70 factor [Flavisolibacter sp.]